MSREQPEGVTTLQRRRRAEVQRKLRQAPCKTAGSVACDGVWHRNWETRTVARCPRWLKALERHRAQEKDEQEGTQEVLFPAEEEL